MKPTHPRPRKMWANYYADGSCNAHSTKQFADLWRSFSQPARAPITVPVAVIPLNDVGKMLEAAIDGVLRDRIP